MKNKNADQTPQLYCYNVCVKLKHSFVASAFEGVLFLGVVNLGLKEQVIKEIIQECIKPLLELKKGFEKQENRVDDITEDLPIEKYPSVNAVINFVKNKMSAFSESISTIYAKQNDFDTYKIDASNTYATKTDVGDLKINTEVTRTATGSAINIFPAGAPIPQLILRGKTTQNGTPTPDAPIPLVSVGDSGSFEVGVYGGNIFDITTLYPRSANQGGSVSFDGDKANISSKNQGWAMLYSTPITVEVGKTYIFKCKISNYSATTNTFVYIDYGNGEQYPIKITGDGYYQQEFYTPASTVMIKVCSNATTTGVLNTFTLSEAQLEQGTVATPYEPCNKQSMDVLHTLRSVGDIKDEVDFNRGVYKDVIFNDLDSNFNLTQHARTTEDYLVAFITNTGWSAIDKGISTHFPLISVNQLGNTTGIFIGTSSVSPIHISIPKTIASDTTTLKQWLIDNDVKFYYPLATPIETPLTETELNAYRQLYTNKGTTTILSEADMEVDYYINKPNAQAIGNIHSQVNKDYFKLQQAIIETGGN